MNDRSASPPSADDLSAPHVLLRQFGMNDWMIERTVAEFTAADWTHRPNEGSPAAWIVGHIAASRRVAARACGADIQKEAWEAAYEFGSPSHVELPVAPSDLLADIAASGAKLYERLAAMTPEEAASKGEWSTPDGRQERISLVSFLAFHETYHVGQLGLLRRLVGRERVV